MAVRGDEVASSIEAHVREAIEKMVGEIRSSVDDVRAAVDSQLEAALQSVQADVNSISFLPFIRRVVEELEASVAESAAPFPAAEPEPVATGGDAIRLRRALQAIERGKSQVDVLNGLLEQCLDFGSRAALLILRGETFSGWKGVGFAAHGGNDESIKKFNAAPGLVPQLDELLQQEHVVEWDGANLATRFGVAGGERAVLIPMVIKDKISAAVYVDATAEDASKLDRPSIEILVFTTGLLVDTLAIRKKIPSPSLTAEQPEFEAEPLGEPEPIAPPSRPTAATPRPSSPTMSGPRPVPSPAPAPAPAHEPAVAASAAPLREVVQPTPIRPSFNEPAAAPAAAAPAAAPRSTAYAPPLSAPAVEDRPSTQFVPPPSVQRTAAAGAGGEDTKKHDEARRFARLLVSEIKLYNEPKVLAGRKTKDLYERLKDDIDRSRQMYDERISEDVRKASNYFYDELVRILAEGDPDALGL